MSPRWSSQNQQFQLSQWTIIQIKGTDVGLRVIIVAPNFANVYMKDLVKDSCTKQCGQTMYNLGTLYRWYISYLEKWSRLSLLDLVFCIFFNLLKCSLENVARIHPQILLSCMCVHLQNLTLRPWIWLCCWLSGYLWITEPCYICNANDTKRYQIFEKWQDFDNTREWKEMFNGKTAHKYI